MTESDDRGARPEPVCDGATHRLRSSDCDDGAPCPPDCDGATHRLRSSNCEEGIFDIAAALVVREKRETFRRTGVEWSLAEHLDRVAAGVPGATNEQLAVAPARRVQLVAGPTFTLRSLVVFKICEEDTHRRLHTRSYVRLGNRAPWDQIHLVSPDTAISAAAIAVRYDFRALRPVTLTIPGPVTRVSLLKSISEQVRALFEREGGRRAPKKRSDAAARDVADAPCGLWGSSLDSLRLRFVIRSAAPDEPWRLALET